MVFIATKLITLDPTRRRPLVNVDFGIVHPSEVAAQIEEDGSRFAGLREVKRRDPRVDRRGELNLNAGLQLDRVISGLGNLVFWFVKRLVRGWMLRRRLLQSAEKRKNRYIAIDAAAWAAQVRQAEAASSGALVAVERTIGTIWAPIQHSEGSRRSWERVRVVANPTRGGSNKWVDLRRQIASGLRVHDGDENQRRD